MYDYMKALQKRFDHQSHPELDTQIKNAALCGDFDCFGKSRAVIARNSHFICCGFHRWTCGATAGWWTP